MSPRSTASWNVYAQAAFAIGQTAVTLLLVRILDPADFGRVAMVYLVAGMVALFDDGGLSTKIVAADERDAAKLTVVFWQEVLLGLGFALVLAAAAPALGHAFGQPDLAPFVWALAPMFVVTAPRRFYQTILLRDDAHRGMGLARIFATVAFLGVTVVLAIAGVGVWSLVVGLITRMSLETLGLAVVGSRRFVPTYPTARAWRTGYGRPGLTKVGERLLNYGVDRVDLIIIGQTLGPTALGVYDVFKRLSIGFYQQVIPTFTRVGLPRMARLQTQPAALAEAYVRQLRYVCLILFPAYLFQAAFAGEVVRAVFGRAWGGYASIFAWISLLLLIRSVSGPINALLMARGWVRRELAYGLVVVGILVGVLLYTVADGLEAAVVAVTWVNVALTVPVYWWVVRPAGHVGRRTYVLAIGLPLLLAVASVGVARVAYDAYGAEGGGALVGAAALVAVLQATVAALGAGTWRRRILAAVRARLYGR